jgi:ABC-type branched-subunit amino acid transport system ATPase component
VLSNVDFEVDDGEIIALLGTNGAGKSTLLKAISGLLPATSGSVIFDGEEISTTDVSRTAKAGIVQVPGGRGVFPTLTVAENLRAAGWMYRKDSGYVKESIDRILDYFPILKDRWDTQAGNLSGGEQQMLSLSQAFIAKPKLLMIDELSLGLAPTVVEKLLDIVRAIHDSGATIILVEQSVNVALRLAQRAVFMEKGEVRFWGPTSELLERPDILRSVFLQGAMAAEDHSGNGHAMPTLKEGNGKANGKTKRELAAEAKQDLARRQEILTRPVVLETIGLSKRYGGVMAVNSVDLQLHDGEILGLIGPNGAGKTTIFDLITGLQPSNGGRVILEGRDVSALRAYQRADLGIGRSFQDARLWPALTVRENLSVALERQIETKGALHAMLGLAQVRYSEARLKRQVQEIIELLGLTAFRDKFVAELSTGSRRIVEIGAMLAHEPKVLLLDEPSSGIAQRETEALGPLLRQVQDYMSCSILIIEHDMPLISSLADHIVALEQGAVLTLGNPDEVLQNPGVVESYLGGSSTTDLFGGDVGGNGNGKTANGKTNGNGKAPAKPKRAPRKRQGPTTS